MGLFFLLVGLFAFTLKKPQYDKTPMRYSLGVSLYQWVFRVVD